MPELPEVETVCRGLAKVLTGARFNEVNAHRGDLRFPFPPRLEDRLKGCRIKEIKRRAKYILIELDNNETLVIHLGMSGRMVITNELVKPGKHDHLVFHFDNGLFVTFNDPRRFGLCDLVKTKELPAHKLFRHLGVEPLSPDLTPKFLSAKFKNRKTSIKVALLDQKVTVGVGNIYACEALYDARISPKRLAFRCSEDQVKKIIPAIRKVLRASIRAGGSSLRDYVQADGELGYFQHRFAVYDREGQPCPRCKGSHLVKRIQQAGRSTFFCSNCQL